MKFLICAIFSIALQSCNTAQRVSQTQSWPLGLWVWSADKADDTLSISIEEIAGQWRAFIQSKQAEVTVLEGTISVIGENKQRFTGQISADKTYIHGYWHQPASDLGYSHMVTRAVIEKVKMGRWQGVIKLQSRPFNVFLDVFSSQRN